MGDMKPIEGFTAKAEARFWSHVQKTESCWLWTGATEGGGYGKVQIAKRLRGQIPDGLELDHLCRTLTCVNPDHLEAVTHRVNVLRGEGKAAKHAGTTHCPEGHEYTEENTYLYQGRYRRCRTCIRTKYRVMRLDWQKRNREYLNAKRRKVGP
jgi:hypothetical protein